MARISGAERYDLKGKPSQAASRVITESLQALRSTLAEIRQDLKSEDLTPTERIALRSRQVDVVKTIAQVAVEVVGVFGRRPNTVASSVPDAVGEAALSETNQIPLPPKGEVFSTVPGPDGPNEP